MTSAVQIAWGKIVHTRHTPKHHHFSYPGFFLRLDFNRVNSIQPSGWFQLAAEHKGSSLYSINWHDYGLQAHDGSHQALREQLFELLRNHGLEPERCHIYLHTFPRVLGYSFNPVSFWFVHDHTGKLLAFLCEVNNTFHERHGYLFTSSDDRGLINGQTLTAPKEFFVSPFFPVAGWYAMRFFIQDSRAVVRIELVGDDGANWLTTSISGDWQPATSLRWWQTLKRYGWFSLAVISKIHWQALRLWLKHVPWFPHPEPAKHRITPGAPIAFSASPEPNEFLTSLKVGHHRRATGNTLGVKID